MKDSITCASCGYAAPSESPVACSTCGGSRFRRGRELLVASGAGRDTDLPPRGKEAGLVRSSPLKVPGGTHRPPYWYARFERVPLLNVVVASVTLVLIGIVSWSSWAGIVSSAAARDRAARTVAQIVSDIRTDGLQAAIDRIASATLTLVEQEAVASGLREHAVATYQASTLHADRGAEACLRIAVMLGDLEAIKLLADCIANTATAREQDAATDAADMFAEAAETYDKAASAFEARGHVGAAEECRRNADAARSRKLVLMRVR